MMESKGTELHGRFERAYSELLDLLSSDKFGDADGSMLGALPPLAEDLQALYRLDRTLYNTFDSALCSNDSNQTNGNEDEEYNDDANEQMLAFALELSLQE